MEYTAITQLRSGDRCRHHRYGHVVTVWDIRTVGGQKIVEFTDDETGDTGFMPLDRFVGHFQDKVGSSWVTEQP